MVAVVVVTKMLVAVVLVVIVILLVILFQLRDMLSLLVNLGWGKVMVLAHHLPPLTL